MSSRFAAMAMASACWCVDSSLADPVPEAQSYEGTLQIVWGDGFAGQSAASTTHFLLALPGGKQLPLELNGLQALATHFFGKRVAISGPLVPNALANLPGPVAISVETIVPIDGSESLRKNTGATGTRQVIYLLLKFPDDTTVPHPPAFYSDLNNPDLPPAGEPFPATLNGFFHKTSWNQLSWSGAVGGVGGLGAPNGWLTLPHTKSYYAPCGWSSACVNLSALSEDSMALARAQGIDLTTYDNINFMLSNDLDCCAWGGGYYSVQENKVYGATWMPPWGHEAGTLAHEMGHSLGLPHSGWLYYAYDSPWDMMSLRSSASSMSCGSYTSINSGAAQTLICTEPGDGYIAPHKDYLGWIPTANRVTLDMASTATITLEANATALGSLPKMIKLCIPGLPCSGNSAHYLTIEARVGGLGSGSQYDNGLAGEGVIIHEFQGDRPPVSGACFSNSQSGWAVPVDAIPNDYDSINCNAGSLSYPNFALYNAQFVTGQTYAPSAYPVSVAVLSRSGSTFVVSIQGKAIKPLSFTPELMGER
jgi:M6 family metalloprotease-like protein